MSDPTGPPTRDDLALAIEILKRSGMDHVNAAVLHGADKARSLAEISESVARVVVYLRSMRDRMPARDNPTTPQEGMMPDPIGHPHYSWTQPACEACWAYHHPGREPSRLNEPARESETCVYCGEQTRSGIYVRVDPGIAPYPTRAR